MFLFTLPHLTAAHLLRASPEVSLLLHNVCALGFCVSTAGSRADTLPCKLTVLTGVRVPLAAV